MLEYYSFLKEILTCYTWMDLKDTVAELNMVVTKNRYSGILLM